MLSEQTDTIIASLDVNCICKYERKAAHNASTAG
jgi:hypothetical protein